jgi:hypothetical protein
VGRQAQAKKARRDRPRLLMELRDQLQFLTNSGRSFDSGFEGEAKRIAVTLRVLLHDTDASQSLLGQLGVKDRLRYVDTTEPRLPGATPIVTLGLLNVTITTGVGAKYEAPLDDLPLDRRDRTQNFTPWWTSLVWRDSETGQAWSRRRFVLTLANKEGGAHIDPSLTPAYERIAQRGFGLVAQVNHGPWAPLPNDPALASVRQIGHEVTKTLQAHESLMA